MRLLEVIGSMNPHTGGPCQTIRNLAPSFIARGNALEVVCLDDPKSDFIRADAFPVHALGKPYGSYHYHPGLLPWLREHLPDYDAVILNGIWQYQGHALWHAAQGPKSPPFYIFPHGMLDPWFQKISVYPFKAFRNWLLWKLIQRRVIEGAAGLLFTCEEERRLARLPFKPYRPASETVVGLGVPTPPEYHPRMAAAFAQKCPELGEKSYFLFLGRIHPKKGVDLLIKGYAALLDSCNGSKSLAPPNLVIAGPGLETTYGQQMKKLASEICPPQSICWPEMLSGDAKWGALYNCEAFVLPSHQENFGIAVVESLACGRPVLISSQVNIWREIADAGAAVVEEDSVAGTSRLFKKWIGFANAHRSQMAADARPCFQNTFSVEIATTKLLATINLNAL